MSIEYDIQKNFVSWCRTHSDPRPRLIYAIPNEARRSWAHAQKRRSEGMVAGMPDLHLPVPIRSRTLRELFQYPGMFIEVKAPNGKLTANQLERQEELEFYGNIYRVIRSAGEGVDLIDWYLGL